MSQSNKKVAAPGPGVHVGKLLVGIALAVLAFNLMISAPSYNSLSLPLSVVVAALGGFIAVAALVGPEKGARLVSREQLIAYVKWLAIALLVGTVGTVLVLWIIHLGVE